MDIIKLTKKDFTEGKYDMSPPRFWYEFYCVKCLYMSAVMKRNRLEMTD